MVTIDYLANGGDYMEAFKRADRLWVDGVQYGVHILQYVKDLNAQGKKVDSTDEVRMKPRSIVRRKFSLFQGRLAD